MTTTSSATGAITSATQQLLSSLNTGSGVDTATLVTSLVQAQFAARTGQINARQESLTAQISGVGKIRSAVSGFAAALASLAKGGSLGAQPTSSNPSAVTAAVIPGVKARATSSVLTVDRLATAQAARTTAPVADREAVIGSGQFTLSIGAAAYDADGAMTGFTPARTLTFDVTDASLDDVAAAINAQRAGVSATVVADVDGRAFLSLKGETGAARAFTLAATDDPSGGLSAFDVGPGAATAITTQAGNARITMDGITVERGSNSVTDLVEGVKLDLVAASNAPVTITAANPTDGLTQAVTDLVDTYNEVRSLVMAQVDPVDGELRGDAAAQSLVRLLGGLTLSGLLPDKGDGRPTTLAEIGVATNRDGSLRVDSARLAKVLADGPDLVQAMFDDDAAGVTGLPAALRRIKAAITSESSATEKIGLDASEERYADAQGKLEIQQERLAADAEQMTERLTRQFAGMNARVAAYKSTQTFLDNQIKAWNRSDG